MNRLEGDECGGDEQQDALGESGQVLCPAVAVRVLGVRGLARGADCDQGEPARREVEEGMRGFAQDAQAAGEQTDDQLGHDQHHADGHRAEGDELRTPAEPVHCFTVSAVWAAPGAVLPQF